MFGCTTVAIILGILYLFGVIAHSKIRGAIDRFLYHVPLVTSVYSSVRSITNALQRQTGGHSFSRVVLVAFPHPGMRAPGFVTSICVDVNTQKNILSVYIPTTPIPTSGYMLLIPEEEVTELDWSVDVTLQAIISGGITMPGKVSYYPKATKDI